jgi:hypothetical protein
MAKRFTDTFKWNDDWYLSLPNDYRIIWQWLLDNCDHAGICKRSVWLMNNLCRTNLSEDELIEIMCGRLIIVGDNWFIPKFLKFQYSTLHSKKPAIVSVVKRLIETNCYTMIPESFGNDYLIIKDKDKDTVTDKDERGSAEGETTFDKFTTQLKADAEQTENPTAAGQERTGQKETQTGVSQTNPIHSATEHRKRLNETTSQMENLRRAMIAGCGGGTPADLKALIDLADARFDAAHSGGAIYSRYLQYVTSCITNERKLPGKALNNQQTPVTTATRLKRRNTEN